MNNRIKELREEKHMTQVRLSIELEVSQETVSAYESGKHYPSVSNLIKLSGLLRASCDYILGLSDIRIPCQQEELKKDEVILLEKYRALDHSHKNILQAYLDGLTARF